MYKFTQEEEKELERLYKEGKSVEELAKIFNKTSRSIISKLARMKIYIKKERPKSTKISNKEYYSRIEKMLGVTFISENFSRKADLETLIRGIKNVLR